MYNPSRIVIKCTFSILVGVTCGYELLGSVAQSTVHQLQSFRTGFSSNWNLKEELRESYAKFNGKIENVIIYIYIYTYIYIHIYKYIYYYIL